MNLFEIITNIQSAIPEQREGQTLLLFEFYEEYFIKLFMAHSPFERGKATMEFAAELGSELLLSIERSIGNFKLKKEYSEKSLEEHLWSYLQTISNSILDRKLLDMSINAQDSRLRVKAAIVLKERYRSEIEERIYNRLSSSETANTIKLSGFELEEFLERECKRLSISFLETKFAKIISCFKNHDKSIFRNYLDSAISNFFTDYIRGENVKKMRRLTLYREDLPAELFDYLKDLKGYGNLFYYKKRYDCLTVRDIGKALLVIKGLGLPESSFNDVKYIFKKSNKRAEYQRIIENITAYINSRCTKKRCADRLLAKSIKSLLYVNDYVMLRVLEQTEEDIRVAKERLKRCVSCLEISLDDF